MKALFNPLFTCDTLRAFALENILKEFRYKFGMKNVLFWMEVASEAELFIY
jgi:hypothetical protein